MEPKKVLLIGLLLGAVLAFFFGPGFLRWAELEAQQAQLRTQVSALREGNQRLYEETRRLREDPSYVEAVARQQLRFVRPGETVIRFEEE